jgi:hypothetical protein
MALDFKFGGEYRIRFYSYDNVSQATLYDHNNPDRNPRGIQIRVRPRFDVSDDNGNMTATLRLEIGDIEWGAGGGAGGPSNGSGTTAGIQGSARVGNGSGGGMDADGVNVETKWAYIDFLMPFGIPARMRAGIQPWFLPKGMIVDNDATGVRVYGTTKPVSYEIAWYRLASGPVAATPAAPNVGQPTLTGGSTQDNNFDEYVFRLDYAAATWLNAGIYGLYGLNKATPAAVSFTPTDNYFLGVTATGKVGIVSYDLDFIFGAAEGSPAGATLNDAGDDFKDQRGFAVDGGVHFPLGPTTIHFVGSFATGDKRDGGDSEAFPTIQPSWNGAGGLYEIIGSGGTFDVVEVTQDAPTNLWMIGAGAEYRPVKALWLRLMYGYVGFHKNKGNCARVLTPNTACLGPSYARVAAGNDGTGTSTLGHELSFRADYDIWTGFKVQAAAGILAGSVGVPATEYILQLYYNF